MAQYEWILDVLEDLKAFARCNGLNDLAEQLDDTSLVAVVELASRGEGADVETTVESANSGRDSGSLGTGV